MGGINCASQFYYQWEATLEHTLDRIAAALVVENAQLTIRREENQRERYRERFVLFHLDSIKVVVILWFK